MEPMLLLRTERMPEGSPWSCELKLDGYRAPAIKADGKVQLQSRNANDFNPRYLPSSKVFPPCQRRRMCRKNL